ncbi:MAG: hypothetical protein HQL48_05510 [Gammaproteobacteria bacterium]|nr:hypothetical protein [Gammaproteobacteria bacterium]
MSISFLGARDRFVAELETRQLEFQADSDETLLIAVAEEISTADSEAMDHLYDQLLQQTEAMMEAGEDALEVTVQTPSPDLPLPAGEGRGEG